MKHIKIARFTEEMLEGFVESVNEQFLYRQLIADLIHDMSFDELKKVFELSKKEIKDQPSVFTEYKAEISISD